MHLHFRFLSILELFLRNLLLGETNELKNRYLHVRWEGAKQDIQEKKQAFSVIIIFILNAKEGNKIYVIN